MPISLNNSGTIFINKILLAQSQQEVKLYIDNSLEKMEQNKEAALTIARFVDNTIYQLKNLNPMDKDAMQWSNINMARIHLQHIKRAVELIPCK